MARFFQIAGLEARRRALVAECEVCRQTLTLEVQNLRLYGARVRRRYNWLSPSNPLASWLGPLAGLTLRRSLLPGLLRTRLGSRFRAVGTALTLWQLYRRFGPLARSLLNRRTAPDPVADAHFYETDEDLRSTRI